MENKPHILHCITSLKVGGAETVLVQLVQALQQDGYTNTVVYFYDGPNRPKLEQLGIKTVSISGWVTLYDPIFMFRLWRAIKAISPDIIHSSLWTANFCSRFIGKLLSIPVVCAIHSSTNLATQGTKNSSVRTYLDRALVNFARKYVLVSKSIPLSFIPASQHVVIQNGIQAVFIHKNITLEKELGITSDTFIIGTVGRFCAVKNYSLLLDSVALIQAKHDHVLLLMIGQGELESELKAQAQRLNLGVKFIQSNRVQDYLPLFDCFVMTSWQEGLSIALLEAMSAGVPPVIIEPTGVHEVVEHNQNGLLVPTYTPQAVATTITTLVDSPTLHTALSISARKTVQATFSLNSMITKYKRLYQHVLRS